jgi:hypothetical protein
MPLTALSGSAALVGQIAIPKTDGTVAQDFPGHTGRLFDIAPEHRADVLNRTIYDDTESRPALRAM